ncbi:hypothetical protein Micbo1qcDRAFT_201617 [Microdochium bolleyi]|uniref:Uncharacterized protein n=1 Tax=Microdochium bolleyi TaxID=196109 RepID=A0A136J914_9PEZI|nr:hypothetical protein Micbo1qcDRAFT_201617 [Microdochium bolleyi]
MASSPTASGAPLPCPAWLISPNSNCHVAKDRAWFGDDYRPISSYIRDAFVSSPPIRVIGIGTVLLPTKTHPDRRGPRAHSTLRLEWALHAPSALCNFIGNPIFAHYEVDMVRPGAIRESSTKRQVAHFKANGRFFECGPSPFDPTGIYVLSVIWPEAERARVTGPASGTAARSEYKPQGGEAASREEWFTPAEKEWLKVNYGGEFRFLRNHGLSIHEEEDRKDGKTVLKALMCRDELEVPTHVSDAAKTLLHSRLVGLGMPSDDDYSGGGNATPHVSAANPAFNDKQLEWIRAVHGGVGAFMLSYGLKLYREEDVVVARDIANALMDDSDDDTPFCDEFDPEGHFADHAFTETQLDWIKENYSNSMTFMLAHGLKFYNDKDIKKARRVAERMVCC